MAALLPCSATKVTTSTTPGTWSPTTAVTTTKTERAPSPKPCLLCGKSSRKYNLFFLLVIQAQVGIIYTNTRLNFLPKSVRGVKRSRARPLICGKLRQDEDR